MNRKDVLRLAADTVEPETRDRLAAIFADICSEAGRAVMDVYASGCTARQKDDHSPVTVADERAEAIILARLRNQVPDVPVVAEEACARGEKPDRSARFILVDPLDGTREFLGRNGEFTVNIALVDGGVPVAGAVYAPALARLWYAGATAHMCRIEPGEELAAAQDTRVVTARPAPGAWTALASRSHGDPQTEAFLAKLPIADRRPAGSSLKFCALAEGIADVYPRFGTTMEWDTAAGDAVLRAAGGTVLNPDGTPFRYGKADWRNGPFVAWADPAAGHRICRPE